MKTPLTSETDWVIETILLCTALFWLAIAALYLLSP